MTHRAQLGRKAMHSCLTKAQAIRIQQPSMLCRFFDILISPVLSYGAHIWGPYIFDHTDNMLKNDVEKVHLEYLRIISGAPKHVHVESLYREYGRYPLMVQWIKLAARWWNKLCDKKDTLAHKALIEDIKLMLEGCNNCWTYSLFNAMSVLTAPFGDLGVPRVSNWRRSGIAVADLMTVRFNEQEVVESGRTYFDRTWTACSTMPDDLIRDTADVDTSLSLSTHKHWVGCGKEGAPHLKAYMPIPVRRILVRLRLGCHDLQVHSIHATGVDRHRRYCVLCQPHHQDVEHLYHFVFECGAYASIRGKYAELFEHVHAVSGSKQERICSLFNHQHQMRVACCLEEMVKLRQSRLTNGNEADVQDHDDENRVDDSMCYGMSWGWDNFDSDDDVNTQEVQS